jgi:S1-C subfamily serine protease
MDSLVNIPRSVVPSVVHLHAEIPESHPSAAILGGERYGAGIAVSDHEVLTAHYLVLGATRTRATGLDGAARTASRVQVDHETGLALLVLEGSPFSPARLESAADVRPGLPVFLLTCAGEGERKCATGHVSEVGPFEAFWEFMLDRAIMTTAINPGLAGGPLFDPDGRVIGVISLGLSAVARYSLAIPVDLHLARPAYPRRAWLGFYPQGHDGGIMLTGIVPGGPAELAGLRRGDLVLSVDGAPVSTLRELYLQMWRKGPGEPLSLQVLRDSALAVFEVVSGDRYDFYK